MQPTPTSKVAVRRSAIEGLGVFAAVDLAAGETVLVVDDSRVVDAEHPPDADEERYQDYLAGGRIVVMQAPERHINHSCDPNTYLFTRDAVREARARRAIRAGEEITVDYCINGSGDTVWACRCGAARCRGQVHSDFFHLPLELQREYLPLLDGWFREERREEVERSLRAPSF